MARDETTESLRQLKRRLQAKPEWPDDTADHYAAEPSTADETWPYAPSEPIGGHQMLARKPEPKPEESAAIAVPQTDAVVPRGRNKPAHVGVFTGLVLLGVFAGWGPLGTLIVAMVGTALVSSWIDQ